MYRLHPDSREKALSMITNVWVGLSDKTLKVGSHGTASKEFPRVL